MGFQRNSVGASLFLGGSCMKTVVELIKAVTGLVFVIALGLVVWGLIFR